MYKKRAKYGNKKTVVDGITFDSKKEANRYGELRLLEMSGAITDLELQKEFELIPSQYVTDSETGKRRCVERPVKYKADFVYKDTETGEIIVEDVKGMPKRPPEYIIKRKILLDKYGIQIREI